MWIKRRARLWWFLRKQKIGFQIRHASERSKKAQNFKYLSGDFVEDGGIVVMTSSQLRVEGKLLAAIEDGGDDEGKESEPVHRGIWESQLSEDFMVCDEVFYWRIVIVS